MPTAIETYNNCLQQGGGEAACAYAAQQYDNNFVAPTSGANGSGNFWGDPTNIIDLVGSAGSAAGQWLNAFGVVTPAAPTYAPPPAQTTNRTPAWVWVLVAVLVLALIILLILFFR